jgi:hypothetical protein
MHENQDSLFTNGKLNNPGQYGDWTNACGTTFLSYKTGVSVFFRSFWLRFCKS